MSDTPKNKKGGPVFIYLAIMFAAAFLMLLLAYFIQQRNNEAALDGLKDSISSFASLDEVLEDNRKLHEELDALKEETAVLEEKIEELEGTKSALEESLAKEQQLTREYMAEALFWQEFHKAENYFRNEAFEWCAQHMGFIWNNRTIPEQARERYSELESALQEMGYDTRTNPSDGAPSPEP